MPAVSMTRPSPPIFTWVAVSGTCLIITRIFIYGSFLVSGFIGTFRSSPWRRAALAPAAGQSRGLDVVGARGARALIVELARDPEPVSGDEHPVVDDGRALGVAGDAVGAERNRGPPATELPRGAPVEVHRRDGLARIGDVDAQLERQHVAQRRDGEVGLRDLLADGRRQVRDLEAHRAAI